MVEDEQAGQGRGTAASVVLHQHGRWWQRTWVQVVAGITLAGGAAMGVAIVYIARHAEPILRRSVIETLASRFESPVELDSLKISVWRGIEVRGSGLRIRYLAGPRVPDATELHGQATGVSAAVPPMLSVRNFTFRASLRDLLHLRTRVGTVYVEGMELRIPPHAHVAALVKGDSVDVEHPKPSTQPKAALLVGKIVCVDTLLLVETAPGKDPLQFDVRRLELSDVGADRPLLYLADVLNPRPTGMVHAFGHIGPWVGDDPRSTALDGDFRFDHADLGTIKGLGGTLTSTGHFGGQLGELTVDGTTETPDFSLDVSQHPMALLTRFHALVDGTTGDTTLAPVQARLGRSEFTAAGTIMRVPGAGHDIALSVVMPRGRIEDLLEVGMKTNPPVMRGMVRMQAKLHVPPGKVRVAEKMQLAGTLGISGVVFSNPKFQDRVDALSLRAQGRPKDLKQASSNTRPDLGEDLGPAVRRATQSAMQVTFSLNHGMVTIPKLNYTMPGAQVALDGVYAMDGNVFEFKGHVRTEARASQMVTGWKSWLLKAADPFLAKNGAGLELPIVVSGVKGDVKAGLAMHGVNESPKDMVADVKQHATALREMAEAKRLEARADREDVDASREKDLGVAEGLHKRAVADRAEAERLVGSAAPPR